MLVKTVFALIFVCSLAVIILRLLLPRLQALGLADKRPLKEEEREIRILERLRLNTEFEIVVIETKAGHRLLFQLAPKSCVFLGELKKDDSCSIESTIGQTDNVKRASLQLLEHVKEYRIKNKQTANE